ncbi:MAG: hypothetical protein EPN93_18455 [Spirochaetes bacterium]|nr:MAG: hypothetical protein EPN93_18455 [Spirochaetota bacterium]
MSAPLAPPRVADSINVTDVLTCIIQEIAARSAAYAHIDAGRTLVCMSSNRAGGRGAIYGKLVPMRFKGGASTLRYRGRVYTMPRVMSGAREQLYVVYFYFPRFFNLPPEEKLRVIFHELHHIGPGFDGDIRRMARVKAAHGGSRASFDRQFEAHLNEFHAWIAGTPYYNFLSLDSMRLMGAFRRIRGRRLKMPKPVLSG